MMINTSEEVSDKEYEDGECSRFKANKVRGQESRNKANYFIIEMRKCKVKILVGNFF